MNVIPTAVYTALALVIGIPGVCCHEDEDAVPSETASPSGPPCDATIHISEQAERQLGGALYEGRLPQLTMANTGGQAGAGSSEGGQVTPDSDMEEEQAATVAVMQGTHMDHTPKFGGQVFMSKNMLHNVEVAYSIDCGVRAYMLNAFVKPIAAKRLHVFLLVVPEDEDKLYEAIRFLVPSEDGNYLHTMFGPEVEMPAPVELYVKFPGTLEPEKFTFFLGD